MLQSGKSSAAAVARRTREFLAEHFKSAEWRRCVAIISKKVEIHQQTILAHDRELSAKASGLRQQVTAKPLFSELTPVRRRNGRGPAFSVVNSQETDEMLQQNKTYFSELFGRGWLLVALFVLIFYLVCILSAKGEITLREGIVLLEIYWAASALYFAKNLYDNFPSFYLATLRRMRRYSGLRWFLQWYFGFAIFGVLPLLYSLSELRDEMEYFLQHYMLRLPIAVYGGSLFAVIFVGTAICHVLAESRGMCCSKHG